MKVTVFDQPNSNPQSTATTLLANASSTSGTAGSAFPITITAKDSAGNTATDYSQSIVIKAYSDSSCSTEVSSSVTQNTFTAAAGFANFSTVTFLKSSIVAFKATDGTLTSNCVNGLSIAPGAMSSLLFSRAPAPLNANVNVAFSTQPKVSAYDVNLNLLSSDSSSSVELSAYDGFSCTGNVVSSGLSGTTSKTLSSGVATFTNIAVTNNTAVSLKATIGSISTCLSSTLSIIDNSNNPIFSLSDSLLSVSSTSVDSGSELTVTLTAKDASGGSNPSGITGVTFDSSVVGGTGILSVSTDAGGGVYTATFTGVLAGAVTISAKINSSDVVDTKNITVNAGTLSQLAFFPAPSTTGDTDSLLSTQPVLKAQDANGNVISSYSGTLTLTGYSDASCTTAVSSSLSGNVKAAISGVATFNALKILKTNVVAIKGSDGVNSTNCFNGLTIMPGAINSLSFSRAPAPLSININTTFSTQPKVSAYDANLNIVTSDSTSNIVLSAYDTAACAGAVVASGLSGTSTKTLASGVATFTNIAVTSTSVVSLKATLGSISTCLGSSLTMSDNSLFSLATSTLSASSNSVNSGSGITVTLTAKDQNGNANPSGITAVTFDSSAIGGTGSFGSVTDEGNGVYSAIFTGDLAGAVTLSAKINSGSVTATKDITVNVGSVSHLDFFTAPSTTGDTDNILTTQPVLKAKDASGNFSSTYSGTITFTGYSDSSCNSAVSSSLSGNVKVATNGVATFTALKILKTNVVAIKGSDGVSSTNCLNSLVINPGAIASLAFSQAPDPFATNVNINIPFIAQPKVTAYDANLNPLSNNSSFNIVLSAYDGLTCSGAIVSNGLSGTLTQSLVNGVASFTDVAVKFPTILSLKATSGSLATCVSVSSDSLFSTTDSQLTVSNMTVNSGSPILIRLIVLDRFGNPSFRGISSVSFETSIVGGTGSFGSITNEGNGVYSTNFTGDLAGAVTISAKINSMHVTDTKDITVNPGTTSQLYFTNTPSTTGDTDTALISQPIIDAKDASGNLVTDYNGTLTFTGYSDASCTQIVASGLSGNVTNILHGNAILTDLKVLKTNVVAIKGSDGFNSTTCFNGMTISPGAIASIAFTTQPAPMTITTNTAFTTQPVVKAYDANSNVVTNNSTDKIFLTGKSAASCAGTSVNSGMSGNTSIYLSNGVGNFTNAGVANIRVQSIQASLTKNTGITACSNVTTTVSSVASYLQPATPRTNHTSTTLSDGRILVVGGSYTDILASAEIYNPTTNSWSSAGSLFEARRLHNAVLLANGKVLIVGGQSDSTLALATAEIYDPATNSWAAAGSMTDGRISNSITLLSNGKVLVTGGFGNNWSQLSSAELYDPDTNTWSAVASLPVTRHNHTASLLNDGRVLVVGGATTTNGEIFSSTVIYDPEADTWSTGGSLANGRTSHSAVVLQNGKVLVVGGYNSSTELYNPATNSWSSAGSLSSMRLINTLTLLGNGKVLVTGGTDASKNVLSTTETYDPVKNSWSSSGQLFTPRAYHTANLLPNGKVLLVGGLKVDNSGIENILGSTEIYDPAGDVWSKTALNSSRFNQTASLLNNDKVLLVGGSADGAFTPTDNLPSYLYGSYTNDWSSAGSLADNRTYHTMTSLNTGKTLVIGGFNGTNYLSSVEMYNSADNSWSSAGSLAVARIWHTSTLLSNGKVIVVGGANGTDGVLSSCELYNPTTDKITSYCDSFTRRESFSCWRI